MRWTTCPAFAPRVIAIRGSKPPQTHTHDLPTRGDVEQEYFIEGTADRYATPAGATGTIVDRGHPYRARVVVRRPLDDKDFNGTVPVERTNVTNGFDAENVWFFGWEHMVRAGPAWVGVSAQQVGVNRLRAGARATARST